MLSKLRSILKFAEDAAGRGDKRPRGRSDRRQVRLCLVLRRRLQVPHRGGRRADEGRVEGGVQVGSEDILIMVLLFTLFREGSFL